MSGRVEAIHLAETEGGPVFPTETVEAVTSRGLAGDRIMNDADRRGEEAIEPKRQVTLIEAEALDALKRECGIEFSAAESRRNICTRGVALNHLVDREFRVGEARLRGIELCEPCGTIERMSGKEGVTKGLIHRGGLRAEVLDGGKINVGDRIQA